MFKKEILCYFSIYKHLLYFMQKNHQEASFWRSIQTEIRFVGDLRQRKGVSHEFGASIT